NSKKKLMEKIILINNEEKDAKILHRKKRVGGFLKKIILSKTHVMLI
ncbi:unnamed protein product, partial [marine sediment metagenome]